MTLLTPRQRETMEYLALGCTNQEIARFLGISVNTVKVHVAALYKELGAGNRTEAVHRFRLTSPASPPVASSPTALAILPFETPDGDAMLKAAGSAMAESISLRLARCRRIPVISHDAAASHTSREVTRLGKLLGASFALAGTLRRQEGQLRLALRLLSTTDGRILWAHYIPAPEVLGFPDIDAVGSQVVAGLMLQLLAALAGSQGDNDPWTRTIRGLHLLQTRSRCNCATAAEHFEAALREAPDLALAHYGAAIAHATSVLEQWEGKESLQALHRHARAGIRLDPDGPDTLFALAISRFFEGDVDAAESLLRHSIRANPCSPHVHGVLGIVHALRGNIDEAIRFLAESRRLGAHAPPCSGSAVCLALVRFADSDFAGAATACREGLLREVDDLMLQTLHVSASALSGDRLQAERARCHLMKRRPDFRLNPVLPLLQLVDLRHRDRILSGLAEMGIRIIGE